MLDDNGHRMPAEPLRKATVLLRPKRLQRRRVPSTLASSSPRMAAVRRCDPTARLASLDDKHPCCCIRQSAGSEELPPDTCMPTNASIKSCPSSKCGSASIHQPNLPHQLARNNQQLPCYPMLRGCAGCMTHDQTVKCLTSVVLAAAAAAVAQSAAAAERCLRAGAPAPIVESLHGTAAPLPSKTLCTLA